MKVPIKEEFDLTSEETWKNLLSKALKINSLDDFQGRSVQGVEIPSFNHPSEEKMSINPLQTGDLDWKIAVSVDLEGDNGVAGVIMAVENGSEAIVLKGSKPDWSLVYQDIYHEMIYNDLHLNDDISSLTDFIDYSLSSGKNLTELRGSISLSMDTLKANVDELHKLPLFHFMTVQADADNIPQELEKISYLLQEALEFCVEKGMTHQAIRVSTTIDSHLPVNVSKLRAIRMIWANLLKAYELKFSPIFIVANTKVDASANKETKLIHNTLASLNAAIGTADLICSSVQEELNSDRLNQNIQHIMKMESKLDKVRDPLAGSYSIEKMSQHLAKAAWKSLTKKQGTFE